MFAKNQGRPVTLDSQVECRGNHYLAVGTFQIRHSLVDSVDFVC